MTDLYLSIDKKTLLLPRRALGANSPPIQKV